MSNIYIHIDIYFLHNVHKRTIYTLCNIFLQIVILLAI